jgi:hypothetical protein
MISVFLFIQADVLTRQNLLGQRPLMCEAGTQIDTHVVDRHVDPSYEWNEWAMRRKALMLVNLRKRATKGAQTVHSHYRRDMAVQGHPPRSAEVQTKRTRAEGTEARQLSLPLKIFGLKSSSAK